MSQDRTKKAFAESLGAIEVEKMLEIFKHRRVSGTMEWLTTILPKDELVLEGGCGLGQFVIWLRDRGFQVFGIDYNESLVRKARDYDRHLDIEVGDVTDIPFPNETFGSYISFGVLEHFPEGPEKAIKEAWRVLKPGGKFIIFVPQKTIMMKITWPLRWLSRNSFVRWLFGKEPSTHYWEQYFNMGEGLTHDLMLNKFKVVEMIPMDYDHSVLTAFPWFRDGTVVDGITPAGERVADWCSRWMKWSMNAQLCLVCVKEA